MSVSKLLLHHTESVTFKEIGTMVHNIFGEENKEVREKAQNIAKSYLQINELINPITLARSSFYIALKEKDESVRDKIKMIKENNGNINKWWIYLVPIMENQIQDR